MYLTYFNMKYQEIPGNLITLALEGKFDVIAHGCNCFCTMGAGIAPHMAKNFGADKLPLEDEYYEGWINKLGQIDYQTGLIDDGKFHWAKSNNWIEGGFAIVNLYSQYHYGRNHKDGDAYPLDYDALTLGLRKMNHIFKGKHIGLPQIGCGLAGGVWDWKAARDISVDEEIDWVQKGRKFVKNIILRELRDCQVTIVMYNGK